AKTTRLTLRPKPSANNELSPAIMLFKRGTELILSDKKHASWRKIARILTPLRDATDDYPTLSAAQKAYPEGWVYYPELELVTPQLAEPVEKVKIVILTKPAPIKAGELLGYMGQFQEQGLVELVSPSKTTKPPFEPLLHFYC